MTINTLRLLKKDYHKSFGYYSRAQLIKKFIFRFHICFIQYCSSCFQSTNSMYVFIKNIAFSNIRKSKWKGWSSKLLLCLFCDKLIIKRWNRMTEKVTSAIFELLFLKQFSVYLADFVAWSGSFWLYFLLKFLVIILPSFLFTLWTKEENP